jgi:hypothetical protein
MRRLALVGMLVLWIVACERVSSQSIATWKGTQKGPDKIEAALRNANVPANLRAEAAAALVDIGRPETVDEILAKMPDGERSEIVKALIDIDIKGLSSPSVPKARDARDALFDVRAYATADERKRIDAALLGSIEKDLTQGRFSGGRHSLDKMLSAIGAPASPMLVRLLGDSKAPFRGLAELVVKIGDESTRELAGAALLKRVEPGRPVSSELWIALGTVGGKSVTDFLSTKMQNGAPEEAIDAARALQQSRFPSVLPEALAIARNPRANRELRGEAFGVIEKIGGPEAVKGLLGIIAEDKDEIVRYRAHEAALAAGKSDAIVPALQAFSSKLAFKRQDVVDFLVKDISKLGAEAKPQVLAALASPSVLARMTAVLALEAPVAGKPGGHLGSSEDAPALLKLADDKATLRGFPPGMTIGVEAKRVAALLQGKGN